MSLFVADVHQLISSARRSGKFKYTLKEETFAEETFASGKIREIFGINFRELAVFAFLARINFREFMIQMKFVSRLNWNILGLILLNILKNNINFFTVLADADVFHWLLNQVHLNVEIFHSSLSVEYHLLIVLMKLNLGLLSKDIAIRYNLSPAVISKIFRSFKMSDCMAR